MIAIDKYHTRKGYEQLYINILRERGSSLKPNLKGVSDFHLLVMINNQLREGNCVLFENEEFELELH